MSEIDDFTPDQMPEEGEAPPDVESEAFPETPARGQGGRFLPRQELSQSKQAIAKRQQRLRQRAVESVRAAESTRALRRVPERPRQPPAPIRPQMQGPSPEELAMAEKAPRYWVRWVNPASGIFKYYGTVYDHGQLLPMRGGPADEKLTRLMFVAPVETPRLVSQCGVCQAEFMNERFLNAHGAKRHSDRFATDEDLEVQARLQSEYGDAAAVDVTGDARERRLMQEFPLALEKTKATLES